MGGFMLCKDSQPFRPLTADELHHLIDNRIINIPSITQKEILDRSKGDSLSKLLVIIQLGWFMLQCAARAVQRLVVTELELVTLAFSILSIVTYVMWWYKPLHVECSIPVPVPRDYEEAKQRIDKAKEEDVLGSRRAFALLLSVLTPVESAIRAASYHREPPKKKDGLWAKVRYWVSRGARHAFLPIGWLVVNCVSMGWSERVDAAADQSAMRVSTFHAGRVEYADGPLCGVAATTIAVTFGGIHCVAWSFVFPSRGEQMLWRTSSLIIVAVPMLYLVVFGFLSLCFSTGRPRLPAWLKSLLKKVFGIYFFSSAILYTLARISLLLQPFLSLRSLPPGAYQAVNWTTFIPHF
jgi:hypothetical protein